MHKFPSKLFTMVIMMLVCSMALSGCEPLRKKFTRQKKKSAKEEFIPVLDPIDYPAAHVTSEEKYSYHFSMWQVWSKDLRNLLGETTMDKRKRYLMAQIMAQLTELKRWVPEEYRPKVDKAIGDYEKVMKELDKPEIMQSQTMIESNLRRTENFVRNELDPKIIFVPEPEA